MGLAGLLVVADGCESPKSVLFALWAAAFASGKQGRVSCLTRPKIPADENRTPSGSGVPGNISRSMSIARMSAAVGATPGLLALQKAEQFDWHLGAGGAGWKRQPSPSVRAAFDTPCPRERHHPDRSHGPHPLPSPDMPSATRWAWECHRLLNTVPSLPPMGLTAGEGAKTPAFAARSWKWRDPPVTALCVAAQERSAE